jgi:hypothetical protein
MSHRLFFAGEDHTLGFALVSELDKLDATEFVRYEVGYEDVVYGLIVMFDGTPDVNAAFVALLNKFRVLRSQFEHGLIPIRRHNEEELVMQLLCEQHIVNAIRRVILAEVPTMAIDRVDIATQNTYMIDEMLVHRLGLIPILVDPAPFVPYTDCECSNGCEQCSVPMTLSVKGRNTYSHDLDGAVMRDILLAPLKPNDEIQLRCMATKGTPKQHAKWASTSVCTFIPEGDEYVFTIESVGQLRPERIFIDALSILELKCISKLN